ncbi:MAG: hypothetical protein NXY57DRAFT_961862 [Lentinula lateritia]|nr:MAG: hypothetical protein NXY57DRAFT_961862 [Lentinula lateritia]
MFSRVSAVTFYALSALVILAAATPGNQPITTTITVTAVSDWRLVLESLLITYHDAEPPPLLVPFSSVSSESLFKMSTFCLVSPAPPSPSSALETVAALPRPYAATIMLGVDWSLSDVSLSLSESKAGMLINGILELSIHIH